MTSPTMPARPTPTRRHINALVVNDLKDVKIEIEKTIARLRVLTQQRIDLELVVSLSDVGLVDAEDAADQDFNDSQTA